MSSTAAHREGSAPPKRDGAPSHTTLRNKVFARLWKLIDASVDEQIRSAKEDVLKDLPERIVEIGPGRGANFSYYGDGTQVIAFEPNVLFHDDLIDAAADHGVALTLEGGDLTSGQLPSASEDAIVSTLVLCSVGDVDAELAEIRRVLRPGGRMVFIEHVAAPQRSATALAQRVLRRPWRFFADGCDLCAGTREAIERAGFAKVDGQLKRLGPAADPSALTYWGHAER
ncbi:MAG: class I SAM-dependent methyltransferase [Gaiellaceae bacterium]